MASEGSPPPADQSSPASAVEEPPSKETSSGIKIYEGKNIPHVIAELRFQKKPWRQHALIAVGFVTTAAAVGAIMNWYLTTLIGFDSLGILTGQLQEALGKQVSTATTQFMLPNSVFLRQGYEMAYQARWDLATREGQQNMVSYRSAFLHAYPADLARC